MPDVVSLGRDRGQPQIQPSMGGNPWPGSPGFFSGGGMGYGMAGGLASLLRRRLGAAPFPGQQGPTPETGGGRGEPSVPGGFRRLPGGGNFGPLGELGMSPEQWVQNRQARNTPFSDLQNLVNSRDYVNSVSGFGPRAGGNFGAGFGDPADLYRKLLMQRQGVQP